MAALPAIMFACYLGLLFYFKARGGYGQVQLQSVSTGTAKTTPAAETRL